MVSGASNILIQGLGDGFAIAPFLEPIQSLITIPNDFEPSPTDIVASPCVLPSSTPKNDYFREIEAIQTDLNGHRGKTVAARIITKDVKIDLNKTFSTLCKAYPDAFVFAFSTSKTGTWIGASPELLLCIDGNRVSTMALAGTRPANHPESNLEWDKKNLDEQKMVEEFIHDCLAMECRDVVSAEKFTKNAGTIEHICTPISAIMPDIDRFSITKLLDRLSPTPALCGSDRNRSLGIIRKYELSEREMYGGFCGPAFIDGISTFYVILRTAKCSPSGISVYAGGGITSLSNPEEEWEETEMKSKTIINKLKTSEK